MNHKTRLTEQVFTMIDSLYEHGVDEIVISPGSRSTPLAIAAELHPKLKTYIHPDERSAAFFALGLYKGSRRPVAIICTSGTAAANYTPAVSEAKYANVPLVVITADRPAELRNIGAPQTMNQTHMYQNFVNYYYELNVTNPELNDTREVEAVINQASQFLSGSEQGPVHLNVQIDEPLLPDLNRLDLFTRSTKHSDVITEHRLDGKIELSGRGLILLGATEVDLRESVEYLSTLNVPIIADSRQFVQKNEDVITNHDLLFSYVLNHREDLLESFDFIIRVGDPFTSKSTNIFLKKLPESTKQLYFSEFKDLKTFPTLPNESFVGMVNSHLKQIVIDNADHHFYDTTHKVNDAITNTLNRLVTNYNDEGRFTFELLNMIPEDQAIFVSNSMPVRDVERYDTKNVHDIFANRGVNGIDGVTSTALGMAKHRNVTLIIGDLAFYHDMNGLLISKLEDININIILFNNNGGGIFNFLPQYSEPSVFERLFGTPMNMSFEHAAQLYQFDYSRIKDVDGLEHLDLSKPGRLIVEIITDRTMNLESHQSLKEKIFEAVSQLDVEL
ncbi:2-succinyl-5-enolpyruvyl-6-hydroxy-3-cyclohexene-1-carboxylic-acid synthase [Aliicoccus persicus]|uniref:2-succinyl-5-enolpyruvyl-6-hydroxy-3-cyclohexene-1-carboxylate synthase n=1 Tax=Aliicoccus persicus TaxID=930138 RepID=A0A662Z1T5_9STAP|nr:2-succinyl-5-enolpyruvyl-6-hydroxy-3-cyclohexene-1-carboxylic-acid synthase [Aliicoccus persicus]SEV88167.1 2-succinyl-5-enolpyruvyl-6-hydroxy-3-cyclohexene-1-carboxylate synthase [Aliicoccus persicus]